MTSCTSHQCTISLTPYSTADEELMSPAPQMSVPEPPPEPEPAAEPEVVLARTPHHLEQESVMRPVLSFEPETIVARPVVHLEPETIVARPPNRGHWQAAPKLHEVSAGARMLGKGHRGPAVRIVQRMLQEAGYPTKEDGLLGPQTQASILAFQRQQGGAPLAERGRIGPETLKALKAKYADSNLQAPLGLAAPVAQRLAEVSGVHGDLAEAVHALARSADFGSLGSGQQLDLLSAVGSREHASDRRRFLAGLQATADRGQLAQAWALLEAIQDAVPLPQA